MKRSYCLLSALLAAQIGCALPALAQGAGEAPAAQGRATETLRRTVRFDEIGFNAGIEFRQLSGDATFFLPAARAEAIEGAMLRIELEHGESLETERFLSVSLADRVVKVASLEGSSGRMTVEVPVPEGAITGGFLKVTLSYSGAHSEQLCIDERASGDFVYIRPSSALELYVRGGALDSPLDVARLMPRNKRLVLDGEGAEMLPFAMMAGAAYDAEFGAVRVGGSDAGGREWASGALVAGRDGTRGGRVEVTAVDGRPALAFGGSDPALGLSLLESEWQSLAAVDGIAPVALGGADDADSQITFAELGAPRLRQNVVGSSTFSMNFAADALPSGTLPTRLELLVAAANSASGQGVAVSVFVNDAMIGSRPLDSAEPEWLDFAVPEGLVGRDNQVDILVQRQVEGGGCRYAPQGFPTEILPQSRFVLGDAPAAGDDFFLMRQAFRDGVTVVAEPGVAEAAWPLLLPLAGALIPDDATVTGAAQLSQAEGPFIYVGANPPAGSDPALLFDQGAVEILDGDGGVMFAGAGLETLSFVQVVETAQGAGIWIRPGDGPAPEPTRANPLQLDRGQLAILDRDGLVLSVARSRSDLLQVRYPDQLDVMQLLAKYRPWIVGAAWLALTLLLIRFLQGVYRKRRDGSEG
ncbi:cellulose biosynthesis cyclic di-GMP-binding regulatory protein BcsB [Salipiger bermudensis]|uniref:cellulose biosynthesis cyclic di-GMP-binding regulatory protein BcsB n=1 Tax=Salipiger bermudensis TaxID=344736 RepID=UPI001CD716C9|nr:cellulose biosynthesis cyclic di-GMP-binding regulatory protein BcsB [Salipiger bermudensis]MCA0961754.1 cellulose biosynthesis cyclic di-GMP-binding regulatory protein BcsB [Salipiger bermudensis]